MQNFGASSVGRWLRKGSEDEKGGGVEDEEREEEGEEEEEEEEEEEDERALSQKSGPLVRLGSSLLIWRTSAWQAGMNQPEGGGGVAASPAPRNHRRLRRGKVETAGLFGAHFPLFLALNHQLDE